jgi:hypothetical protein
MATIAVKNTGLANRSSIKQAYLTNSNSLGIHYDIRRRVSRLRSGDIGSLFNLDIQLELPRATRSSHCEVGVFVVVRRERGNVISKRCGALCGVV